MKKLLFWWWCLSGDPINIRIFYRAGCFDKDNLVGWPVASEAFKRCSKLEQEFIVWRDPVFAKFLDDLEARG